MNLTPKHAGGIAEWSRNMVLQSSPDVETLARNDLALQLAETLDYAAIAGTGAPQPTGILNTPGIEIVSAGANGGVPTYDMIADLVGALEDANAEGPNSGFLMGTKARRALTKLQTTYGEPLGLDTVLQGKRRRVFEHSPEQRRQGHRDEPVHDHLRQLVRTAYRPVGVNWTFWSTRMSIRHTARAIFAFGR